jgi:UDP-N-acetylmuramoyl-tripeptide--D-alanyl-D-alanine ligase
MTDRWYHLADAAEHLQAAGLLRAVVVADSGAWRTVETRDARGRFHGAVLDSREAAPDRLFVGLRGTRTDGRRFAASALAAGAHALAGPADDGGAHPDESAPEHGTLLVCDDPEAALTRLAACWRRRFTPETIGVTGSNGKTTTKDLLAALLSGAGPVLATRGNLNSAQGVPVTLLDLGPEHRYAVIEMGASAVGHIAARAGLARPRIGIITNASAAHLQEFGSLDGVVRGKGEMVEALPDDGVAILDADQPAFAAWRDRASCRVVSWGRQAGDHHWDWQPGDHAVAGWLVLDGDRWPVPLPGRHNAANLCAAILAARAAGAADDDLRRGLSAFRASPHRGHVIRLGGRTVLDDCYNANPASMVSAVAALLGLPGGRSVAVLGGMAELGPDQEQLHRECGRRCAELGLSRLVAVGDLALPLGEGFAAAGGQADFATDHAAAADLVATATREGDRILLKGSRSTAMEKVLDEWRGRHGWQEEAPA